MNRFAETVNADYLEVGKFFREIAYLPNVLFQPGYIGGHCVMPNIASASTALSIRVSRSHEEIERSAQGGAGRRGSTESGEAAEAAGPGVTCAAGAR